MAPTFTNNSSTSIIRRISKSTPSAANTPMPRPANPLSSTVSSDVIPKAKKFGNSGHYLFPVHPLFTSLPVSSHDSRKKKNPGRIRSVKVLDSVYAALTCSAAITAEKARSLTLMAGVLSRAMRLITVLFCFLSLS